MTRSTLKWLFVLLLLVLLFYWKIVFTRQFSVLSEYEGANQAYSWYNFTVTNLKHGALPLWDPYTHAGSSFVGEMQTALFYPLKLILVLLPFTRAGLLSPHLFQQWFVLAHFIAACCMFALIRDLGLSRFSALVGGLCFALGGMVGRIGWPDMLDTAAWLPIIFLFLRRALHATEARRGLLYAGLAGLALGLAVLGGRLHVVIMDGLVVVSLCAFFVFQVPSSNSQVSVPGAQRLGTWGLRPGTFVWAVMVAVVVGAVGLAAGAVQLFPSIEYSRLAERYLSDALVLPANQKIPYIALSEGFGPRAILAFLLGFPFNGSIGGGENFGPYCGILPFLLALVGAGRNWNRPVVRYLAGLALLAFFYSLGAFSFLHGLLYSVVPLLWMAREAGRFIYLTQFALAALAAFGVEALFVGDADALALAPLKRAFKWLAIAALAGLAIPAFYTKPDINDWVALSVLLILAAYGLFVYVLKGNRNRVAQFLVVALILCDLSAFNWTVRDKIELARSGRKNHLDVLLGCRGLADFLKSRPGLFRVQVLGDWHPNIGDAYGVQTIGGMGATLLADFERFLNAVPHSVDLLNVRYLVKPKGAPEPGAVYEDKDWKVYENANCYPRAWLVHEAAVEPSPEKLRAKLGEPGFDPHRTALLSAPLPQPLEAPSGAAPEQVTVESYAAKRIGLSVMAEKRALLVLSEICYPGWYATVNNAPAPIYKADGALRAIVLPPGRSTVLLRYAPRSVLAGAVLSLLAFGGVLLAAYVSFRKNT
jgi:hypothetical protein